jgi:hypothetical protein
VPHGVFEQIQQQLGQPGRGAKDRGDLRDQRPYLKLSFVRARPHPLGGCGHKILQVHGHELQGLTGVDARQDQQALDEGPQALAFLVDVVEDSSIVSGFTRMSARGPGSRADDGERCTKVVCSVSGKPTLPLKRVVQPADHRVKCSDQPSELVVRQW